MGISLLEGAHSYRGAVVGKTAFDIVGPVRFLGLYHQSTQPTFFVLGGAEDHFDGSALPAVGLQLAVFGVDSEVDAGVGGEVSMEFSEGLDSIGQFKFEAGGFVDSCGNVHLVVDWWWEEVESNFVDPFAAILCAYLEISQDVFRFEGQDVHVEGYFI